MQIIKVTIAAAGFVLAGQAAAQSVSFDVGGVKIEMPVPHGYCLPSGEAIAMADQGRRSDADNVTHQTLYACDQMAAVQKGGGRITDYYLIKTPKSLLASPMTRQEVIAALTAEMTDPNFSEAKLSEKAGEDATAAISQASGTRTQVTTDIRALGGDKDCAYMGGLLVAATAEQNFTLNVGGCMTAVGNRVMFVFRYTAGTTTRAAAALLPDTRRVALSMKVK